MGVADPSRETGVVCACACPCGIETAVAFFRSYVPGLETAIAFAGENRLVLACFSVAVVLSVSTVAVRGRALVTAVSCWPASAVAEASMVSKSLRRRVRCVKKFALRAQNTPNLTFLRLLGEFCRGLSGGEGVLGEFCRACRPATTSGPGSATGPVPAAILCGASVPPHRRRWGFCSIRSWLPACRRRVGVLMTSFPHVAAVRSRFEAKVQTHWVKTLKTGCCGRGGLCFGHNVTWYGLLRACGPLNMRVVPLIRT